VKKQHEEWVSEDVDKVKSVIDDLVVGHYTLTQATWYYLVIGFSLDL
jgi:hypothetical protein